MTLRTCVAVGCIATMLGWVVDAAHAQIGQADPASESAAAEVQREYAPELDVAETAPPAPSGWKLPQPEFLQKHNISIGGWLEQGITANALNPQDRFNGPDVCNDRNLEYQMNQALLHLNRPTKTDGCGWDLGGRIDLFYGTDWRLAQSVGLENRINDSNSFYGFGLPQFYAEVAVNDLTVKMGHFATLTSLESPAPPLNFFYSYALLACGYFDPAFVTGLQADYKLTDNWTAVGGFNRGEFNFENPANTLDYLGGAKWTSDNKQTKLSLMVQAGPEPGWTGVHDRWNVITVYTCQITERFLYGSQYTAGIEKQGSFVRRGQDASWYGTEQLFTYKLNDKWSAGLRYEWVRDNDGSRVVGVGNVLLTDRGWDGRPGCAGAYNDLSLGLNWRPKPNWVLRPEVRWDWYDGVPNPEGQLPYGNHTERQQFLVACDLVVTF